MPTSNVNKRYYEMIYDILDDSDSIEKKDEIVLRELLTKTCLSKRNKNFIEKLYANLLAKIE